MVNGRKSTRETRIRQPEKRTGFFGKAVLAVLFFCLGCGAGVAAVFYYFSLTLPAIGPLLEGYEPPQTTRILARDGTIIGELFTERRTVVPLDRIPKVMIDAVLAAEDADFRHHEGLDYRGMIRAVLTNLVSGKLSQGASTITQQVARTFFLSREKTFARKIREILLTKRIEERLTKDEILFLYLNQINFGHARYGVYEATRFYFGKTPEEINLLEAATLAGIPKGPAIYSPITHPDASKRRRAYVLGEMAKLGGISASDAKEAMKATLHVVDSRGIDSRFASEAVSRALQELKDIVGMETLRRGGYVIETTLDPKIQAAARAAVLKGLTSIDKRHGRIAPFKASKRWPAGDRGQSGKIREGRTYVANVVRRDDTAGLLRVDIGGLEGIVQLKKESRYNPKGLKASRFAAKGAKLHVSLTGRPRKGTPLPLRLEVGPQSALVTINPKDGSIVALVGGDSVEPRGFDRAVSAQRQPGSTFKPFVYLAAIQSGRYTAATLLDDAPEVHGEWQPKNANKDDFKGAVRLRRAVAGSINLPAVKLISDVGPNRVIELATRLGTTSKLDPTPSLALGASAVSPLEIASAYAAFGGGGKYRRAWIVKRITGPGGVEIPLVGRSPEQAITEQEAYLITSLLRSVVEGGTGSRARKLGRPAAGKTGTSNDQRDAWFVGYTPDLVCAVWVGYDDLRSVGRKEYGSRAALPIWLDLMKQAHAKLPKRDFEKPLGIVTVRIDPASGLLAWEGMEEAVEEIFIEGTEPTETAVPPDLVAPDNFLMDQLASDAGSDATPT
ncbi:MAG: PBP1A family penicillin-binding protein [Deltaproteobacteria bacterium]|nr:PBP1A family penicillin-binding protein [Deltaproteobacteria bacterium]